MPALITDRLALASRILLPVYLLVVGFIVFAPSDDATQVTGVVAVAARLLGVFQIPFEPAYVVLEFVANIALFVPFGILVRLAFARPRWWAIALLGFASTVSIELIQLALPTRFSTVSDVVANTLGTLLGLLLVRLAFRRLSRVHA